MKIKQTPAANSDVFTLVEQVPMDNSQRVRALATLRSADAFVDRVVWVANSIKYLFKGPERKPQDDQKLAA